MNGRLGSAAVIPSRTPLLAILAGLSLACSHTPFTVGPDQLKTASEEFERSIRFQDYGGASSLIVTSKRAVFLAARRKEAGDLTITDMELIDVQMAPDGKRAQVISRMRWVRLPSVSEVTAEVSEQWEVVNNAWLLSALTGGPFREIATPAPPGPPGPPAP
jgi:hypothetical protein